ARTQWAAQGLAVEVRVADAVPLPMHVQTALLRIAQGAIANVVQHAHADSAVIELVADADGLRFAVSDDGDGFDLRAAESGDGGATSDSFGLQAARERVQQLGGTLVVESAPGRGTSLTVLLATAEAS
ncbi:ATPase/histidine kinase/DNA gyrase B/HSP90 domain protein, partial [Leifsonia aquatica ATCC 14665]